MASQFSRTDLRYWYDKVKKPPNGKGRPVKDYSIQISFRNRRTRFPLRTANKDAAAKKAQTIYLFLLSNGWEQTIAKFKDTTSKPQPAATVGELIGVAREISDAAPRTFSDYCKSLRRIVADIQKIETESSRFDPTSGGGNERWRAKVDRIPLDRITPFEVQKWKREFIKPYENNPAKLKARKNSANSFIRQAKALFAKKHIHEVSQRITLPDPLPFEGVKLFPRSSSRYVSTIDAAELLQAAMSELGAPQCANESPEHWRSRLQQFKVFLLGICVGLRRNEIDTLLWNQFLPEQGLIRIQETKFFKPKSEDSADDVELEPELVQLFEELKELSRGDFVIESSRKPTESVSYDRIRAEPVFADLYAWLREKGITENKPLHTLRKEFGSMINKRYGIYAASRALRHADTSVTAAHYLDKKERTTFGFRELLDANSH